MASLVTINVSAPGEGAASAQTPPAPVGLEQLQIQIRSERAAERVSAAPAPSDEALTAGATEVEEAAPIPQPLDVLQAAAAGITSIPKYVAQAILGAGTAPVPIDIGDLAAMASGATEVSQGPAPMAIETLAAMASRAGDVGQPPVPADLGELAAVVRTPVEVPEAPVPASLQELEASAEEARRPGEHGGSQPRRPRREGRRETRL